MFVIIVFLGPLHSFSWSEQRRPYDTNPVISIGKKRFSAVIQLGATEQSWAAFGGMKPCEFLCMSEKRHNTGLF